MNPKDGWVNVKLDQIGTLFCGQSPSASDVNRTGIGTPYFTGPEQWDGEVVHQNKWTTDPRRIVPDGCIFITVKGAGVGTLFPGAAGAIGRDLYAFQPQHEVSFEYIRYALKHNTSEIVQSARGDIPGLSRDDLVQHPLPLAPVAEQHRIVSKINSVLAKSNRARGHLDHLPRLVEKYKQAVLDTCFARSCERLPLLNFVENGRGIPYGIIQTGTATQNGVPTVRCGDIKGYGIDIRALKQVNPQIEAQYERTRLRGGEVLIAIRGSVGNTCVASNDLVNCNISREVAMIPILYQHVPSFFAYYLTSTEARAFIIDKIKGVAQQGINLGDLRKVPIPVLKPVEQGEIVHRIEAAFRWIDGLAAEATNARQLIKHLDQAVLSKAFRGELVPQDLTDEPASVLLERVMSERNGAAQPRRSRGRPPSVARF